MKNLRLDVARVVAQRSTLGRICRQYHEHEEEPADGQEHEKVSGGMLHNSPYFRTRIIEILCRGKPRKLVEDKVLWHIELSVNWVHYMQRDKSSHNPIVVDQDNKHTLIITQ